MRREDDRPAAGAVALEICLDTLAGAQAAAAGGAARVELCSALSEGGLTPSAGLMQAAAKIDIPCYAMIRPRAGLFMFAPGDEAIMHADIHAARAAGLAGVVLGVQDVDGGLDLACLARLLASADGMGTTLHRVIDVVPEPLHALEQAIALGFDRVLTSGAEAFAPDGAALIAEMVRRANEHSNGRVVVMPGCGITPENVAALIDTTGVREVHAACSRPVPGDPAFSDFDPQGGRMETSVQEVEAMVAAIHAG